MCGLKQKERIRNAEIKELLKLEPVCLVIKDIHPVS